MFASLVDAGLAQLVEHRFCKPAVVGSTPIASSILITCIGGEIPEWSKGADCKSVGSAFEGSNPSLATTILAGVAQLVEHQPSKLGVVSSNLIARSIFSLISSLHQLTWLSGRALPW